MVDEFTEMIRIAAPDGGQNGNFVNKLVIFCEKFTHFRHEKNTIIRYYTYQIVKHIYYLPLILKTAAYGRRSFPVFVPDTKVAQQKKQCPCFFFGCATLRFLTPTGGSGASRRFCGK